MELETQILWAGKLEYLSAEHSRDLQASATQVGKSLAGLINSLHGPTTEDRRPTTDSNV